MKIWKWLFGVIAVVLVFGFIFIEVTPMCGDNNPAKLAITKKDLRTLSKLANEYYIQNNFYPLKSELVSGLKVKAPKDPWGTEYIYDVTADRKGFKVYSLGEDIKLGGTGMAEDLFIDGSGNDNLTKQYTEITGTFSGKTSCGS